MNNQTTTIAFSIYSNKGVYAFFLGSGISKSSGIPTGWDIVIDLIRQLAKLKKQKCEPNPVDWFKSTYGEEPNYSNILTKLAKSSAERVNLLKPYFEPTQEEVEQGLKMPSPAHKAIAQLVKDGHIKVIITTNFDRLIERSLNEVGIEPTVIRHPDDIDGAIPIVHNAFTLIKINGDYLDSRFLNTQEELSSYPPKLHDYLVRIVNEFGLLSCGWSAKWDNGFIKVLKHCENFRFHSYWTYLGDCEIELKEIAEFRKGEIVKISSADAFFTEILEKIESLKTFDNHPLNTEISVARLKKYIVRDDARVLLHDLVFKEQEEVYAKIREKMDVSLHPDNKNLMPLLEYFEACLSTLIHLIINGVFWAKPEHYYLFTNILSRLAGPIPEANGSFYKETKAFYYFPSLFTLYTIGIAAVKSKNYKILCDCFHIKIEESESEHSNQYYLIEFVNACMIDLRLMNKILNHGQNYHTPISTYLCKNLKPYFSGFILSDKEFNDIFDVFEYLLALNYVHIVGDKYGSTWAPFGQFQWRKGITSLRDNYFKDFFAEAEKVKSNWKLLESGMFDGSFEKYVNAKLKLDEFLKNIHLY